LKLKSIWLLGARDMDAALAFTHDLESRLANRVQLTSDGHRPYLQAVEAAFGDDVDYAMLIKIYGADPQGKRDTARPSALDLKNSRKSAGPTPSISARPMLSAAISRCGCTCAVSRD
jgi:hypothetical protein